MPTTPTAAGLTVRQAAGHIGAFVSGVDLKADLDAATVAGLRQALHEHKVLFLRGQHLDHAAHVRFAERFGPLAVRVREQDTEDLASFPQILTISAQLDNELVGFDFEALFRRKWVTSISGWHTDGTQVVNPPAIACLRAEVVPAFGGDTHWTNLAAAYQGLSEPVRAMVDGLQAEHMFWPLQQR